MGLSPPRRPESGPSTVEVLNRAAGSPAETGGRSGLTLVIVTSVTMIALLLVTLVVTPIRLPPELGRRQRVEVRFGDPFAVDWLALAPEGDPSETTSASRPLPMASLDPACVGFGRVDWPEDRRQPTVAHCAEADDVARLASGDVALFRKILVGRDTWYLLRFGGEVTDVLVDAGVGADTDAGDRSAIEPPPIYRVGPYAAVLLPNRVPSFQVTWELRGGARYHCEVRSTPRC